jgi:hypothetical protein
MQWSDIPRSPDSKTLRQFSAIWVVFFGGMAVYQYFAKGHATAAAVIALLACTVGPLGLVRPQAVKWIYVGWMMLAFPIGWTISTLMLGLLYYGIFTPLGVVFRARGRDLLGLKPHPDKPTYWHPKPAVTDPRRYLREF